MLVLQVARKHDPASSAEARLGIPDNFTPEVAESLNKLLGVDPKAESLDAGIPAHQVISKQTAEAAEKLLSQFLLPHIFGLYDVVVNGGQDRDMVRSIRDFILAAKIDRLRPSDVTKGVRALRGQPEQKIREWMGRFCAMGWLEPEADRPGVPPKTWQILPGLREHFAERRKQAQAARAVAHEILKAGGSRRAAA